MVEQIKYILALCCIVGSAQAQQPDTSHRVLLISIDGLRPEFYTDSVHWPAPTLQAMARSGVSAPAVQTVFPSVTYPAHTTLVTGAWPGRHGILGNIDVDSLGNEVPAAEYSRIQAPTIWELAHSKGMRTAAIGWPVTIGAPIDYMIPEAEQNGNYTGYKYLPMFQYDKPGELLEELETQAIGKMSNTTFHFRNHTSIDIRLSLMAAHILQVHRPGFMALHIAQMDEAQHKNGRNGEFVRSSLAFTDALIFHLVNTLRYAGLLEHTTIVITGDHGFTDYHYYLSPNSWLKKAGLYNSESDWQVKFLITGSSGRLIFNQHRYRFTAQQQKQLINKVTKALQTLPDSIRRQVTIHSGAHIPGLMNEQENMLLISSNNGFYFDKDENNPGPKPAHGGAHGSSPLDPQLNTGLIVWGTAVKAPAQTGKLLLTDVFPLLSRLITGEGDPVWSRYIK
jgi:predicted AlkP superfamily pyrophosphatase or phosphodiesterase